MKGLSVRAFHEAVNAHLPPGRRVSLGTVSNYEQPPESARSAPPRSDYVAAVKAAFPELRLEWLLLGDGSPTLAADRVAAAAGAAPGARGAETPRGEAGLGGRVLAAHPDLSLLSPEASALFVGALTRYAMGEPGLDVGEERILDLAADLRWILLLPLSLWGFRHEPDYEAFSAYSVAMLHALALALPGAGGGDPASAYAASPNRTLREILEVGFRATAGTGEAGGRAAAAPAEAEAEAPRG